MKNVCLLFALLLVSISFKAQSNVDLPAYLSNFDLKWNQVPEKWSEGAFLGNGRLGTMIWHDPTGGIRFDIGDTQVYNGQSRAPIGKFVLKPSGKTSSFSMTQSLPRSEVKGAVTTNKGGYTFETFIDANADIVRIRYQTNDAEELYMEHIPLPGVRSDELIKELKQYANEEGISPIVDFTNAALYKYIYNLPLVQNLPSEEVGFEDEIHYRKVPFNSTSGYILLWNFQKDKKSNETVFCYTTCYYNKKEDGNLKEVMAKFALMLKTPYEDATEGHYAFWEDYFNESFISIPDKKVEANYWIQLYKMRAATREGELPIDLLGPWFRATPWPRIWSNLNIQITYPAMNQANKFFVAKTLFDFMDVNKRQFIEAVKEPFQNNGASIGRGWAPYDGTSFWGEYGNYLWLLYNYSQFLEYYPDDIRRQEQYYPMLKRGLNFVIRNLTKDDNGMYHVPKDISPEYKINGKIPEVEDNSYNIGLMKWALKEALYLAEKYNDKTPEVKKYQTVQKKLTPLVVDEETGIMIGKDVKMEVCHRHFSHLIAFYPLAVLDVNKIEEEKLARKSVHHWLSRPPSGWGFKGYTYTAATAMYARLGDAKNAWTSIHTYLDKFATPNTFYIETGPVIETPMHSASVTLELLLQSFSNNPEIDEIRICTAVPKEWENVSFSKLRAEGGYVVSATMKNNKFDGAFIESLKERKVRVVLPSISNVTYKTSLKSKITQSNLDGFIVLEGILKKGESLQIGSSKSHEEHQQNVTGNQSNQFNFGIN